MPSTGVAYLLFRLQLICQISEESAHRWRSYVGFSFVKNLPDGLLPIVTSLPQARLLIADATRPITPSCGDRPANNNRTSGAVCQGAVSGHSSAPS